MIVDITYPIESYPKQNELTHIVGDIKSTTGGAVCNTIIDLARLDPSLPLFASGFAGHDKEGDFMMAELGKYPNIDLGMVKRNGQTAFTIVMSNDKTKERTFFCYGILYAAEMDMPMDKALKLAACTAAASLGHPSACDGVKTADEVLKLYDLYK